MAAYYFRYIESISATMVVGILFMNYDSAYSTKGVKWSCDSKYEGVVPVSGGYQPDVTTLSIMQCARMCKDIPTQDCRGFVYISESSTCQLHNNSWSLSGAVLLRSTASFYKLEWTRTLCQEGWTRFGSSCYLFVFNDSLSFNDSQTYCTQNGGHLVYVDTLAENDFLKEQCRNNSATFAWIGIDDIEMEGRWVLSGTQTKIPFVDWHGIEPNGGTEVNCGGLYPQFDYRWVDEPCHYVGHPICELS